MGVNDFGFLVSNRHRYKDNIDFTFFGIKVSEMDLTGKRAVLSEECKQ
jgi:hypothetical protein